MAKLRIRQVRSAIGRREDQGATLKALGIRKLHHEVVKEDSPSVRGMVEKIRHLVDVEEIAD